MPAWRRPRSGTFPNRRSYLSLTGIGNTPKLLMRDTGINSGFMILQYTSAALTSENKTLCFPASADSIVTSLGQEDHVSMGSISGRKALQVIDNLERILAIELLWAAQAIDFRRPLRSSPLLEALHAAVRKEVAFAEADRVFAEDIDRATNLLRAGALLKISRDYGDHIASEPAGTLRHGRALRGGSHFGAGRKQLGGWINVKLGLPPTR